MTGAVSGWFETDRVRIGDTVRWRGSLWQVAAFRGEQITLRPTREAEAPVDALWREVEGAPDFAVLGPDAQEVARRRLPPLGELLEAAGPADRKKALWWHEHMTELQTGLRPGCGTPRPGYEAATFEQRCRTKSAELAAAGYHFSWRALDDRRRRWKDADENPLVLLHDGRAARTPDPGGRTDRRVIALMHEVAARHMRESGGRTSRVYEDVETLVRQRYRRELEDPREAERLLLPRSTFYTRMKDLGLTEQLRQTTQRRSRRASKPTAPYEPTVALRPGQLVQIDTTPLKIKMIGDDGVAVSAELTAAIDVASRNCIALMIVPVVTGDGPPGRRIGGRATKAFDLVLLLAQCFAPLPMRPGWDPLTAARASALPYNRLCAADARFAGAVAARPVIHPRTLVIDQGSPYMSDHFKMVCSFLGIGIEYARKNTPTDKPLAEAFFRGFGDTFSQFTKGWTGRSFDQRGYGIERQRLYSINQLQAAAEEWLALDYQQQPHEGLRSPLYPGLVLSPNQMYAHLVAGYGYRPRQLTAEDNRKLLVPAWVTVTDKGVQIANRTYQARDGRLRALEGLDSQIRRKNGRWEARYNPYYPDVAWLYDHRLGGSWIPLEFIYRHLLADCPWTHYHYQDAAEEHALAGGGREDEVAISLAVKQRHRRTRRGPTARQAAEPLLPFRGVIRPETGDGEPVGGVPVTPLDPDTVPAASSLPVPGREVDADRYALPQLAPADLEPDPSGSTEDTPPA
ncbi:transposase [Streptomyces chrestomyceticus]|uniref:transposase n=1 Tax=Streptomyces chrestomyceticus TaxID=68185 RepID=UPI0036CA7667